MLAVAVMMAVIVNVCPSDKDCQMGGCGFNGYQTRIVVRQSFKLPKTLWSFRSAYHSFVESYVFFSAELRRFASTATSICDTGTGSSCLVPNNVRLRTTRATVATATPNNPSNNCNNSSNQFVSCRHKYATGSERNHVVVVRFEVAQRQGSANLY
jgi:hypothetical protein